MPSSKETILVIDDDPEVLSLVEDMLHGSGYTVLTTGDPQVALLIARTHPAPIHLLLTDVVMPLMAGSTLSEEFRILRPPLADTMNERTPHESPAKDLDFLVWNKVERGRLFLLPDPKCWAGPATGHPCVVCEQRIHDPSECAVVGPDGPVFAHLACHSTWSLESQVRRQRPHSPTAL